MIGMQSQFKTGLIFLVLLFCSQTRAEFPTSQPFSGVRYWHESRAEPAMSLYVVQVDLKNPDVKLRLSPAGPDPDGDGEWQTVLMPPSEIAKREAFDICINASFFSARQTQDVEGEKSGFVAGKWSKPVGLAMTDGRLWSSAPKKDWPTLWVDRGGVAHLSVLSDLPNGAQQAVQGNCFVLKSGVAVEPAGMMKVRHPRTVVGLDKDAKTLTILTVDGRRPGVSIGMTGPELGAEMKRLGCEGAMNLDGGGSTELVLRDPGTDKLRVMNQPSDGRERAVADVLGVQIRKRDK
jgi:exopolysaccharide biosynthesis protein